jgi:hypothetical protein
MNAWIRRFSFGRLRAQVRGSIGETSDALCSAKKEIGRGVSYDGLRYFVLALSLLFRVPVVESGLRVSLAVQILLS